MLEGILTFMVGTGLLYYGGTMTFLVPGDPGESFLQRIGCYLASCPF
jgi:hypothetical protein